MRRIARQLVSRRMQATLLASLFSLAAFAQASAGTQKDGKFPNVKIKNFGQMDERFYRGAQPSEKDYKALAELGVTAIIDLRNDPRSYARVAAEAAGMRYFNIPMSDKKKPADAQIEEFLKIVKDSAGAKFFVHCVGGRHRTGVMGAVYRFNHDRWNYDQAYKEMKEFDYYSRWGHGALKDYVQDYYERMQTGAIHTSTGETTSSQR